MTVFERTLNFLSWVGFLVLAPVALAIFGISGPLDFLKDTIGKAGSAETLALIFLGLILLRVLFGKSERYAPVLIGLVVSFLLLSTVLDFTFMSWYRRATDAIPYTANHRLIVLVAAGVPALGILLGGLKRLSWAVQVLLLIIIPLALIVTAGIFGYAPLGQPPVKALALPADSLPLAQGMLVADPAAPAAQ